MSYLILKAPTIDDKQEVLLYKKEFLDNEDSMDGTAGLRDAETVEGWIANILDNSKEETVHKGLVPSYTFLALRKSDNKIVGMIDIRHRLNEYLLQHGGHIGYSVRKSERCKGYAKEMLRLALEKCVDMKIEKVLVTCNNDNIASKKTIIANAGVFENEISGTERYWINLLEK